MPRKPIDFSKTIIYKIQKDDDFYVGSTTDFTNRKRQHKQCCNNENIKDYNLKVYQTIREKGGWNAFEMIPLEEYVDCQNKTQARIREEEWREKLNAKLNMRKAFGAETTQEYQKQYRQDHAQYRQEHKEENKAKQMQYYQNNKEKIAAKKAQKFECECGSICRIGDKSTHLKSKKHQAYLATL